jgi:ribosomal-protein-alanine N-acetyltransferase
MTPVLPHLTTPRLAIRHLDLPLASAMLDFFARNRNRFARWDPPQPTNFYTLEFWHDALGVAVSHFNAGQSASFAMQLRDLPDSPVIGRFRFSQITRGAFHSCILGYQIDAGYEGQGLMREALEAGIEYMFTVQRLHRIQANYRPDNTRSGRLLERLGFEREGYAKDYLFIGGAWQDHVLTAKRNPLFDARWLAQP